MSAAKHWGEFTEENEIEHIPDVTADIERSMNKFFLREFDEDDEAAVKSAKIVVPPLNSHMSYTISLHKYWNNIADMIKLNQFTETLDSIRMKIPEMPQVDQNSNLNVSSQAFHEYALGNEVEVFELSKTVVQQILIKSIATIFAHFGYETSCQSTMNVLVDVLQEFFQKICHQVKVANDDENLQFAGFPHVIERVLTETGIGGVKALNDHYQNQVIKYSKLVKNRCKDFIDEYETLPVPKSPSPVDKINKVVRVKVEEEEVVEVENPEVHFAAIDGDVNLSILETGYQFLEVVENLQSLGGDDMTVSESAAVAPVPSEDISHLSPFSKKKRLK